MNELILTKELTGLPESKSAQIKDIFDPMVAKIKSFELKFNALMLMEDGDEKAELARELRLDVAAIRIESDKARKLLKAEYLLAGNAIQGVHNIVKFATIPMEEKLKEVEMYRERMEAKRIDKLGEERREKIREYCVSDEDFAEQTVAKLGYMSDSVWPAYFLGKKTNFEAIKEAERKAEEQRVEAERKEAEERERIRKENEKLKAEQEELRAEQEAREAEFNMERMELESRLTKERKERKILEAEKQKQEQALETKKREIEAAPDKEKIMHMVKLLRDGRCGLTSPTAKTAVNLATEILVDYTSKAGV